MGTVMLTHSHNGLHCHNNDVDESRWVRLSNELLDRPILDAEGEKPVESQLQGILRAVLRGMCELRGFDSAISLRVTDTDTPHITLPLKRIWGEISLERRTNIIVRFSHDSREENKPYAHIIHWLEQRYNSRMDDEGFDQFAEEWSRSTAWKSFFEDAIRAKAVALDAQADNLQQKHEAIVKRAASMRRALQR